VDGAKVRANAGREQTHDRTYYEKHLKEIDVRIDQVLDECEEIDRQRRGEGSLVAMDQDLGQAQNFKKAKSGKRWKPFRRPAKRSTSPIRIVR